MFTKIREFQRCQNVPTPCHLVMHYFILFLLSICIATLAQKLVRNCDFLLSLDTVVRYFCFLNTVIACCNHFIWVLLSLNSPIVYCKCFYIFLTVITLKRMVISFLCRKQLFSPSNLDISSPSDTISLFVNDTCQMLPKRSSFFFLYTLDYFSFLFFTHFIQQQVHSLIRYSTFDNLECGNNILRFLLLMMEVRCEQLGRANSLVQLCLLTRCSRKELFSVQFTLIN